MNQLFIGRQAIFDRTPNLFGYELLYRGDEVNKANFNDGHLASSHVIITTFLDIGLERLVGSNPAFINLTRDFILGTIHLPVTPEQVVLEIPRDVVVTPDIVDGLRRLYKRGFTISLDDELLDEKAESLLRYAHIVKVDTLGRSQDKVRSIYERFRSYPIKLLAEKIETEEMFYFCRSLGFDYFQGFYLHRTQLLSGKPLPNNERVIQKLMHKLQDTQVQLADLERLITLDPTLSYQLLRYINCATYGMRQEVASIHQALQLFSLAAIRQWIELIDKKQIHAEQPRELLKLGLARARACECLAKESATIPPEQAFTVGLFSVLAQMLEAPIEDLLDEIPLSSQPRLAMLDLDGPLGSLLAQVLHLEQDIPSPDKAGKTPSAAEQCHREGIDWAQQQIDELYR